MEAVESRRYWVFQGRPERYDLDEQLEPDVTESWPLTRFRDRVAPGDIVYFWRAGRQSGLVGWGEVAAPPKESPSKGSTKTEFWVPVTYRIRFSERIDRDRLTDPSTGVGLSGLTVLRTPSGTNFKVTTLEANALNRLLEALGEEPPPDPQGMVQGRFPAQSVEPLNFGRTVSLIVEAAVDRSSGGELDGRNLLDATLLLISQREQRGTVEFLRAFFEPVVDRFSKDGAAMKIAAVHKAGSWQGCLVTREALDILESARLLAISSTRKEEISVRHFFAALLQAGEKSTLDYLAEFCRQVDRTLGDLVNRFIESTATAFFHDDTATWVRSFRQAMERRLEQGLNLRPGTVDGARSKRAVEKRSTETRGEAPSQSAVPEPQDSGYAALAAALSGRLLSDRPSGSDHLRIRAEVAALAHAFARRSDDAEDDVPEQRSTIALGLFGRWGSGKSFFMTKLRTEIERLSNEKPPPDGRRLYCERIEQIEFNAWHYKEADLWASLVHHIFDTLQRRFEKEGKEADFKKLIQQLDISKERRAEIAEQLEQKQDELKRLSKAIGDQERQIEGRVEKQLSKIATLPERLAKNAAARGKLLELLPQAAGILGLSEQDLKAQLQKSGETADELLAVIRNTGAAAAQTQTFGRAVLQSAVSWKLLVIGGIVLAIYFGVPVLLGNPELWNELIGSTGQVVALATGPVAWVLSRLKSANDLLNQIGGVEAMLKEDIQEEERQKDEVLTALQNDQDRISKQILLDKEREARASEEIQEIEEELAKLGSSQSLVDFINERARSSDYRSRLGILALIRRDFETLSMLMTGQDQFGFRMTELESEPDGSAANEAGVDDEERPGEPPQIDRIILYIDDLDRVSDSQQVLRVMEAVHLLLSLPLFNVVVAVDEWWAAQSVLSHYKEYFAPSEQADSPAHPDRMPFQNRQSAAAGAQATGEPAGPADSRKATPREFLEKVFQICFWVRPLGQELAERLIEGTVRQGSQDSAATPVAGYAEPEGDQIPEKSAASERAPGEQRQARSGGHGEKVGAGSVGSGAAVASLDAEPDVSGASHAPAQEEGLADDENGRIAVSDSDFVISSDELATLQALARVVGRSPRTVKRFINTYRLLKAILIHQLAETEDGETADPSVVEEQVRRDHTAIMVLLAIQIGQPDVATRLFELIDRALGEGDQQSFDEIIQATLKDTVGEDEESVKWRGALEDLLAVLVRQKDVLELDKIASFDSWLLPTARFGFEEWEPRSERLWN